MHVVLKSYIDNLRDNFQYDGMDESKYFELFSNYCLVSKYYVGRFDPASITTNENDAGIDGIAIIIDGELVENKENAALAFDNKRKNISVDIIINQVKSGEKFIKSEISNFSTGVMDFFSENPKIPHGSYLKDCHDIFYDVIVKNLDKVLNNMPNLKAYYCTSGNYAASAELEGVLEFLKSSLEEKDYFYEVSVLPIGRRELFKLWKGANEKNEAAIKVLDYFSVPSTDAIPQAYVAIAKAKDFVSSLLIDDEGLLKKGVFEENVRAFLGGDNFVNEGIQKTIRDDCDKSLFSILNNGVTIVSPQVSLKAGLKEINLFNYQIINGCQTSNVLYENFDLLDDDVNITVRVIESPDSRVSEKIISATNSQTGIGQERFHGLKEKARLVQQFFYEENKKSKYPYDSIYFERRENEYRGEPYYSTQIFDVKELVRAYASGVLSEPHTASRYVKDLFVQYDNDIFKETDSEALYYMCSLILYKFNTLVNGRKENAYSYSMYKWHIIPLFIWVSTKNIIEIKPNSNSASKSAQKIIDLLKGEDKKYIKLFKECFKIIDNISPRPTRDQIKRSKFISDLKKCTKNYLNKN